MRRGLSWIVLGLLGSGLWVGMAAAQGAAPEIGRGVVVEEVGKGSALEKAGIEPGDWLLSWRRLPVPPANPEEAQGEFESAFDWMWLVVEQAPRGTVELIGRRAGEEQVFTVEPGLWEGKVRPWKVERVLQDYRRGREHVQDGELDYGPRLWAKVAESEADWRLRCWIWLRLAEVWAEQRKWEEAHAAYSSALGEARGPLPHRALRRAIGMLYQQQGDFVSARVEYSVAQKIAENAWGDESLILAESLSDLGAVAFQRGALEEAATLHQKAREIAEKLAPNSLRFAAILDELGDVAQNRGDLKKATKLHERALRIKRQLAPGSLPMAISLHNLGSLAWRSDDLGQAARYHQRALEIRQDLAPDSLDVAASLNELGVVAAAQGKLEQAEDFHRRALEIYEDLSPDSSGAAASLNNLGYVFWQKGDLSQVMRCLHQALEIKQKLAPNSLSLATILNNIGVIALERGHSARAMDYFRRSLEIREELAPDTAEVASSLSHMGSVASERGDLDRAKDYGERALRLVQRIAPVSLVAATIRNNLGQVAWRRGDLKEAMDSHRRALEIRKKLAPRSPLVATSLGNLGLIARDAGDLDYATECLERALEIRQELAPGGTDVAYELHSLGVLAELKGDLEVAKDFFERSREIKERLTPDRVELAETLHKLGRLHLESDPRQPSAADSFFRRALETLDNQLAWLGGSHEVRAGFRARYDQYYHDALVVQLELGDVDTAFHTLEKSRARSFLENLAERDTVFTADIPEELDSQRRRLAVRFDRTQRELARLDPRDHDDQIEKLLDEMSRLRGQARDIEEEIRRTSSRLASLRYPQPLDLEAARAALDPGTLMLSYSVGEDSTVLFTVSKNQDLRVDFIAIRQEQLKEQIQDFDRQIGTTQRPGSQRLRSLQEQARSLYTILIEPVADRIESSERLLILADGPLHYLPWGALLRDTTDGSVRYLVAWKPLHFVLSATVYAELRELRPRTDSRPEPVLFAAFGDPRYPGTREQAVRDGDVVVRSVAERGFFDWAPLPHSRREVEAIAGIYPPARVRVYVGEEATEERAKSLGRDVRIVHFATHAEVDERFPLNSYLALTVPEEYREGRDNGLLQAWEIFERVRLDADLVVLSACETALGEEQGGEGLVSLTRAFQYAGARTVAASLWQVDDQATAELMTRFHWYLRDGKTKDEALRAAQLELIDGEDERLRVPYFWAGFQLYGDWQ